MSQEIVIGPNSIDFLHDNYKLFDTDSEGQDFIKRIQDNTLCADDKRILDNTIEERIYDIADETILSLWTYIVSTKLKIKRY